MRNDERPAPGFRPLPLPLVDRDRALAVLDLLEKTWHRGSQTGTSLRHEEPLDGLIFTVLSQNTNDRNRDLAYARLRERFPKWRDVMNAPREAVMNAIKVGGLNRIKTMRIQEILKEVKETFGSFSLKDLRKKRPEEVRFYLESIPGVGPKTAACVLLFDLGIPAFPVDTHVARVTKRLGWVPQDTTPFEIQCILEELLPKDRFFDGHLNLIHHGRMVCKARKPSCPSCPIRSFCVFPDTKEELECG